MPVRKKSAWLITWEGTGLQDVPLHERVISIQDPRISPEKIRRFVEESYIATEYDLGDKLYYASRKKKNPYPAKFGELNGIPWKGRIDCGHNPHIYARLVDELVASNTENNLTWNERPLPNPSWWR